MKKETNINFLIALLVGATTYLMTKNAVVSGFIFFIVIGGGLAMFSSKRKK